MEFGVSVLKGVSGNKHTAHFVLYDWSGKVHLLHSIIDRLPTDAQRQFIIDEYADESVLCISRSASGESTDSIVVYSSHVVVYSSLVCLQ